MPSRSNEVIFLHEASSSGSMPSKTRLPLAAATACVTERSSDGTLRRHEFPVRLTGPLENHAIRHSYYTTWKPSGSPV